MRQRITIQTNDEFYDARNGFGLSVNQLADILKTSQKTIRKWERQDATLPPNPTACRIMEWMINDAFVPYEME